MDKYYLAIVLACLTFTFFDLGNGWGGYYYQASPYSNDSATCDIDGANDVLGGSAEAVGSAVLGDRVVTSEPSYYRSQYTPSQDYDDWYRENQARGVTTELDYGSQYTPKEEGLFDFLVPMFQAIVAYFPTLFTLGLFFWRLNLFNTASDDGPKYINGKISGARYDKDQARLAQFDTKVVPIVNNYVNPFFSNWGKVMGIIPGFQNVPVSPYQSTFGISNGNPTLGIQRNPSSTAISNGPPNPFPVNNGIGY